MNEGEWLSKMLMLDARLHHITLLTDGTSCRFTCRKIGGNCPRFAKPLILIPREAISEMNSPRRAIPEAKVIQFPSHLPPISVPANAIDPSIQSACSMLVAPVAIRIGSKYKKVTSRTEPTIPLRRVFFVTISE